MSGKGLLAITLWGASFICTRIALRSFHPVGLVAVRLLAGTTLLCILIRARGHSLRLARADWGAYLLLGVTLAVHLLIQAYGMQYTSAIHASWIIGFIPVTIALGAHLLGKQRIGGIGWLGVAIGTSGVLIVAARQTPDFAQARWGDLLQITSCLTWTVYTLAAVTPVARSGVLRVTTVPMGIAAVLATIAALRTGVLRDALTLQGLLAAAFLGFLCSGLAYYLWFQAVSDQGPARTGSLLYLEPFVTLAISPAVLHETVTLNAVIGGLCVLAGVWAVARGSRAREPD